MDEEIDRLVIGVRADTAGFARDVAAMRASLEGPLGQGADKAGRMIETSLARAVASGKLGFDTLGKVALAALSDIGAGAIRLGLGAAVGGGGASLGGTLGTLLGGVLGLPGRATGGPVSPGRAYMVGERGPEMFVPTSSGRVEPGVAASGGRDLRVSITVNAAGGEAPGALRQSSRQVARAVRAALAEDR
jgi:phage-related minor tail protein